MTVVVALALSAVLAARGATPSAFERRCIPAGGVAPPSNIPDILSRRALPSGRLAVLFATMELHHGLLAGGQAKTHGKESIRVYISAAEVRGGSPPDDALQGRLAAVRELRDALRRKAGLSVVDDRAQADVIVEVTDREQQNAGEGGFGGVKLTPFVNTIIRVRVTFGEHQSELKGMGPGTGSRAAKDAADGLLKWIERNRADRPPPS